ncbi:hypothetical protein DH2020_020209 [Rehmannia glutinosa]|uniref:Uncharacterized protein n=1 Tax=Rehmannia glutinosa TaxID=99300 RepID=A0ABR0WK96_REHGL
MKKDHFVDCNDEGAEFVEAQVVDDVELMDLIAKIKSEQLNDHLLSRQSYEVDEATDPLLSIQITEFKCGGRVISITVSHRIADASSIGTFIAVWSSINNANNSVITISPTFNSHLLFPGKNMGYDFEPPRTRDPTTVVKHLLFNKEAITSLRSKLRPKNFSRVRLVSALISKALIGVDRLKHGKLRSCFIAQAVNMRERTFPPLPNFSIGNLDLVYLISDAINKTVNDCAKILSLGEDGHNIIIDPVANLVERSMSGEINVLWFSDWSKIGFYEADFGWGKPFWAGIGTMPGQNLTVLMNDQEGDGIEAWVHLNHNDLIYFEQDDDLKMFTVKPNNPSADDILLNANLTFASSTRNHTSSSAVPWVRTHEGLREFLMGESIRGGEFVEKFIHTILVFEISTVVVLEARKISNHFLYL